MKFMSKTTKAPFQRILVLSSVLILVIGLTQCSKLPTEPKVQPNEPEITGLHDSRLPGSQALATVTTSTCEDGTYLNPISNTVSHYRICKPDPWPTSWNGDLVVYAHGYVAPHEPVGIPEDQLTLPDGTSIPELINQLGYAFVTTSYYSNGLVESEPGIADLIELVEIFKAMLPENVQLGHVYLIGVSEGGLIATLAVEQQSEVFSGGLAICGPIGNFRKQINYFGDFRVVFDYFFPGVLPESPISIPQEVIDNWELVYKQLIINEITSNPHATEQLLRVTRAAIDPNNPDLVEDILGILWYNISATNDVITKLGGQPFDNRRRLYFGSDNDFRLNRKIQRFRADPAAINEINIHYQTSGDLDVPLVTLHTTKDERVPYWHEPLYRLKVFKSRSSFLHTNIPIFRYGHCNFKTCELLVAFAVLVLKVTAQELIVAESVLPDAASRAEFLQLAREHGARPKIANKSLTLR